MKKESDIIPIDYNSTIEFYKKYLATPREDWQKEIRRPVKTNILKAMCATHAKYGRDPVPLIKETILKGGRVYYWSDLHLFHGRIIEYANRPFDTALQMNQMMLNNYRSKVTEDDLVIFCGDISFADEDIVRELLAPLPGKKVLVLGNHDFNKSTLAFKNYHVFDIQTLAFYIEEEIEGHKYGIIVSHYPIASNALPNNVYNIHGHIHQHPPGPKHLNVSVEHTGYAPVDISEDLKLLILCTQEQGLNLSI